MQYKILNGQDSQPCGVTIVGENIFIPLYEGNTDYQQFKKDLANGVALSDAEGNPMTADQIKTFLEGLA